MGPTEHGQPKLPERRAVVLAKRSGGGKPLVHGSHYPRLNELNRGVGTIAVYMNATDSDAPLPAHPTAQRWLRRGPIVKAAWVINIGLLVVLVIWMWNDRRFTDQYPRQVISGSKTYFLLGQPGPNYVQFWPSRSRLRWGALRLLASLAVVSFLAIVGGLFFGEAHHRRLRSCFMLLTLAAAWLAVATSYDDISWTSSTWSLAAIVSDVEQRYAAPLRRDWPSQGGSSPQFGSYTAHPGVHPTLLQLTNTPYEFGLQRWGFDRVTRAPSGALRFSLTGQFSGLCLEWHPAGSTPDSYIDGQNSPHTLSRVRSLDANWYATKYGHRPDAGD
jgi:hypothetical protein